MDPKKRKRIDEEMARWVQTDPTMVRLRERIDYYQARIAERERVEREGGTEPASGDRAE